MKMVKLFFVGDVCSNNSICFSEELTNEIKQYDIKCCNFEAPVIDEGMKPSKKAGPVKGQNKEVAKNLIEEGFNLISIANNHIMDYGKEGLKETFNSFESQNIIGAGFKKEDVYKPYIYEKDDLKIGFLSVAENGFGCFEENEEFGYAWMYEKDMNTYIKELKKSCSYVVINIHAGAENLKYPLPEIRELYKEFIDMGADIIIGHHPHVVQGYEKYKNGIIFYSLGNFYFPGFESEDGRKSYGVSIELNKKYMKYDIIPLIYENGIVKKNNNINDRNEIDELSEKIQTEDYVKIINQFSEKMYETTYKRYYVNSIGIKAYGFIEKIKTVIKLLIREDDNFLMYHNLNIETHLWLCKRALKNRIMEEKNDKI